MACQAWGVRFGVMVPQSADVGFVRVCGSQHSMGFFKNGNRGTQLYMRSDAHGERMQKVYALDYCAASFVTEGACLQGRQIYPRSMREQTGLVFRDGDTVRGRRGR